ncbi:hypothetical protein WKY82_11525 [Gordonia malaquae]|uniref:hypothetical protein n=1 Tax=Gordonia malaquae TaxID=410332 RepID=UPI0030C79864
MKPGVLILMVATAVAVAGCGEGGGAVRGLFPGAARQTDDHGRELPFRVTNPRRWNDQNDGTTFEPCTGLAEETLRELMIDPSSAEDTETSDAADRGCRWTYSTPEFRNVVTIQQVVADPHSGSPEPTDTAPHGSDDGSESSCSAQFTHSAAVVTTTAEGPSGNRETLCMLAMYFHVATTKALGI